jgi:DNA invertase Pin-like site-specific DNA recombinase
VPMKRSVLYMRVSSLDQHPETQLHDQRQMASQRGYQVVKQYTDRVSGAKAKHPALDELLADARKRKVDVILVANLTQIFSSVRQCIAVLNQLNQLGVGFVSCREGIDTMGAMGQAMMVVIDALSELERNLRIENVRAGIRRAQLEGVRMGRRPLDVDRSAIVSDRRLGMSLTAVGKKHRVSRGTVCRLVKLAGAQSNMLPPCTDHPLHTASARAVVTCGGIQ